MDNHGVTGPGPDEDEPGGGLCELLRVIETGSGPAVDVSSLLDRLARSPGFAETLADRTEVHNYQHPLASLNAYKHRLQALRREHAGARLRAEDLEAQLAELRAALQAIQGRLAATEGQLADARRRADYFQGALDQMLASRAWKLAERCSRWGRLAAQLAGAVRPRRGRAATDRPTSRAA